MIESTGPDRVFASGPRLPDTETLAGLVRLVVEGREVVGAVVIRCPVPWVYRRPYLVPEDVD